MNIQESIPIPRKQVFVLIDGSFVVQWESYQVQNLLSGKYDSFSETTYGSAITDFELNQLRHAGVVEKFDSETVYLCPSPDVAPRLAGRSYYLNTTRPKTELSVIQTALEMANMLGRFSLRVRDDFVVIWGKNGAAFRRFEEAEQSRELLANVVPDFLSNTVVAFVEIVATG